MSLFQRTLGAVAILAALFTGAAHASPFQQIQNGVAREPAECVSWSETRMDCFTRTFGNGLSWVFVENNSWNLPRNLGGTLAAPPSCVVRGPNGINCFATTDRGALVTIALNGGAWTKWSSLGGALLPARVSCVSTARDHIACYARGLQGQLLERTWNGVGTWEPWKNLGGAMSSDPACLVAAGSGVACFGRGAKGTLVAYLRDAATGQGSWETLGGRVEGRPSCTKLGSGDIACISATGSNELQLWRGAPTLGNAHGSLVKLDVQAVGEPTCSAKGAGLQCAWRNASNNLVMASIGEDGKRGETRIFRDNVVLGAKCLSLSNEAIACALTGKDRTLQYYNAAAPLLVAEAKPELPLPVVASVVTPQKPAETRTDKPKEAARKDDDQKSVAAKVAAPGDVSGAWYLTDLASGSQCRVTLTSDRAGKSNGLAMAPDCKSLGLSRKFVSWEKDASGLHFAANGRKPRIHFASVSSGQWLSPRRKTALMLSRLPVEKPKSTRTASLEPTPGLENGLRGMAGAWRVMEGGARQLCRIELSPNRHSGGYAVESEPACPGQYQNVQYWNESGTGLVLVGSGHVVVARFVSAGQDRWRAQNANGVVLVR